MARACRVDAKTTKRVLALLADRAATRTHMDVVANAAPELAKALAAEPGADRQRVVTALEAALKRLEADATLSRADRLSALLGRVQVARLDQPKASTTPKLPAALVADVREQIARFDREIVDGYERQAVITGAAYTLGQAGLWADSDALLKANLAKSHSPYYLMSQLGGNARKLGRNDEALRWYEQAFAKSEGPATRLQWGAGYLNALIDLAPNDAARIESAAARDLRRGGAAGRVLRAQRTRLATRRPEAGVVERGRPATPRRSAGCRRNSTVAPYAASWSALTRSVRRPASRCTSPCGTAGVMPATDRRSPPLVAALHAASLPARRRSAACPPEDARPQAPARR